jgi:hypothetical protein
VLEPERLARELAAEMSGALPEAAISMNGNGTQTRVHVVRDDRSCVVHCFWYGDPAGLVLGLSSANAHLGQVTGGLERTPRSGAEYLIVLHDGAARIAGGRTHTIAEAIRCARAWVVERRPIDELYEPFPFIDHTRRSLARVAALIEAALGPAPPVRVVIERDVGYELWAYGDRRSCRVDVGDAACACAFLVVQSQVAGVIVPEPEVAGAVAAWTQERVALDELRRRYPELAVAPHGELLVEASEVARWHWRNVLEGARQPGSVLSAFLPLIERVVERPSISSFFSFTSLARLCFSSSSNYPFVTDGLPVLSPAGEARYIVELGAERREVDVEGALEAIEAALAAAPHRPFHGSAEHLITATVDAELVRQGSSLRVELQQARQWYRARLSHGRRICELWSTEQVTFREEPGGEVGRATFPDLAATVRAARRWLEEVASPEEVRAEAAAWTPPDPRPLAFDPD